MSKSLRNEIAEWANDLLLRLTYPAEADALFEETGFNVVISAHEKDLFPGFKVTVQGASPIMSLTTDIPRPSRYKVNTPENFDDIEWGEPIFCTGYSKLKVGDTWSGAEGFRICVKRASRDYADHVLEDIFDVITKCEENIELNYDIIDAVQAEFFVGKSDPIDDIEVR